MFCCDSVAENEVALSMTKIEMSSVYIVAQDVQSQWKLMNNESSGCWLKIDSQTQTNPFWLDDLHIAGYSYFSILWLKTVLICM